MMKKNKKTIKQTAKQRKKSLFFRDERGVTVIEFALLAPMFFGLLAIILQTALLFIAGMVLDNAVDNSVRIIRTGEASSKSFDAEKFRAVLCGETVGMLKCDKIRIIIKTIPNFKSASAVEEIVDEDGNWEIAESYTNGVGGEIIIAKAYYKWDPVVSFDFVNIGAIGDGSHLLASVRVWRNEPF
jgi:Flp pilus assembly pilin Flp